MGQLLDQLKNEIVIDLKFLLRNLANKTRPGAPIRVKDTITFDVDVLNVSGVKLTSLSGFITPGAATSFTSIPFIINTLNSGQEIKVSSVEAQVVANPNDLWIMDSIAKISISAYADLSKLIISDREVLYTFVPSA
jgi:hypothetical protein